MENCRRSSILLRKILRRRNVDWGRCKIWTNIFKMGTNNEIIKRKCRRHFESVWQWKIENGKRSSKMKEDWKECKLGENC